MSLSFCLSEQCGTCFFMLGFCNRRSSLVCVRTESRGVVTPSLFKAPTYFPRFNTSFSFFFFFFFIFLFSLSSFIFCTLILACLLFFVFLCIFLLSCSFFFFFLSGSAGFGERGSYLQMPIKAKAFVRLKLFYALPSTRSGGASLQME